MCFPLSPVGGLTSVSFVTLGFPDPKDPQRALQSADIARLFHHFIVVLAPWYDLSDALTAFGTEVPQKALGNPLLFAAILALAAIHLSQTSVPKIREVAEFYHEHCIKALIVLDPQEVRAADGVPLAATCLLRSYELLAGK